MRVLFDTNVWISAILARGVCETILESCVASAAFDLITSEHILAEFERITIEKFRSTRPDARLNSEYIRRYATIVLPVPLDPSVCRDPADVPVLGAAIAGRADILVTGDADLLELRVFQKVRVLSPRAFYDLIH